MDVQALYVDTLSALKDTKSMMLSPDWLAHVKAGSDQQRLDASHGLIDVQRGITALSNAVLSNIADKMEAQADDLKSTTSSLRIALLDLSKVQTVLQTAGALVSVVSRIVPLI